MIPARSRPQRRPAVPVGLGQGPVDQPVHGWAVVLAEVGAHRRVEAAVVLGHDRLPGVVPEVVRVPNGLPELVLQALGGVRKRLEVGLRPFVGGDLQADPGPPRDSSIGLTVSAYLPLPKVAKPRVSPLG